MVTYAPHFLAPSHEPLSGSNLVKHGTYRPICFSREQACSLSTAQMGFAWFPLQLFSAMNRYIFTAKTWELNINKLKLKQSEAPGHIVKEHILKTGPLQHRLLAPEVTDNSNFLNCNRMNYKWKCRSSDGCLLFRVFRIPPCEDIRPSRAYIESLVFPFYQQMQCPKSARNKLGRLKVTKKFLGKPFLPRQISQQLLQVQT